MSYTLDGARPSCTRATKESNDEPVMKNKACVWTNGAESYVVHAQESRPPFPSNTKIYDYEPTKYAFKSSYYSFWFNSSHYSQNYS